MGRGAKGLMDGLDLPYGEAVIARTLQKIGADGRSRRETPDEERERLIQERQVCKRKRKGQASDDAVRDGEALLLLRVHHRRRGWEGILAELHMSRRTANYRMALAIFAHEYPELYAKFRELGPTKLSRLASHPEAIRGRTPESEVVVGGRAVKLGAMSDREFQSFLRKQCPAERPPQPTLIDRLVRLRRALKREMPDLTVSQQREALKQLDGARRECQELFRPTG